MAISAYCAAVRYCRKHNTFYRAIIKRNANEAEHSIKTGMYGYLTKPIQSTLLTDTLKK
ncbi:hypothetical protein GPUN_2144 [Glaciecola punicea ACAM 611]|uniref:Uncharacterized protein n=1 Tax=Glaciecola punicea ACAM 611 TaxID=1121923 RepID=H5TD82_9ALTE|nr:hypothetical protein GPUN_2144 [Glaciecola punicea ACAM 611]